MFYINFQKCVSLPTRSERSRMSTFDVDGDCAFKVPCIKDQMMKATKDGRPWKQWVTSNRGKCWFECCLVPRDNHSVFSSLK